ncbi:MAG: ABC transporter ATP-binding protein [Roseiflexaceae bacterium]|nr:ABC transporter ATP-binding protein [Roseiflexaceae bacterium]
MGFVLDGLDAEDYDRSYSDRALVRRIVDYFRPHVRAMVGVALVVVLGTAAEAAAPFVISWGIDLLTGNPTAQAALALAGSVALLRSLGWFFNFVRQSYSARVVGDVVLALRNDAFKAVMQRDMSFYDQYASGKIVSRVTSDTQDFAATVTLTLDLFSQFLLVAGITTLLFVININLALIVLAIMPLVFVVALAFRRVARSTTQRSQRATAEVNSIIQETISGIGVAKSFRQEGAIYQEFKQTNALVYRVRLLRGWVLNTIFPALDIISGLATALVVYFGAQGALGGQLSAGEWFIFIQVLNYLLFPLTSIASFWSQFQQGLSSSERVFALIDAEPNVVQTAANNPGTLRGRIEFEQVWFSYDAGVRDQGVGVGKEQAALANSTAEPQTLNPHPSWVLRDFSLDIPVGQTLAVVGHTGAGKSSLVRLITRFYEFQRGDIRIDGASLRALDLAEYRRQIGLVPQVPFLFSGTVADNIRYGRESASDAEVEQAARQLGGGEWIDDLPEGLATDVGERGARLSLGQRQLVALARVLLQNPAVFILDEATASVDPFTESQIQAGLDAVMHDRTSIVIAHRLSTVRNADRIIVMRAGAIIEQGTHTELIASGGHYAELYNTYFRHQSLEYIESVGAL